MANGSTASVAPKNGGKKRRIKRSSSKRTGMRLTDKLKISQPGARKSAKSRHNINNRPRSRSAPPGAAPPAHLRNIELESHPASAPPTPRDGPGDQGSRSLDIPDTPRRLRNGPLLPQGSEQEQPSQEPDGAFLEKFIQKAMGRILPTIRGSLEDILQKT